MMRFAVLSLALALGLVGCVEPVCTPAEHGRQCGAKPGTYTTCEAEESSSTCTTLCLGGDYGFVEHSCPATRSMCVDYETASGTPDTECLGEIIGSCSSVGFVRCEGNAIVECIADHTKALVLSRGQCGPGTQCGQQETSQGWYAGCI